MVKNVAPKNGLKPEHQDGLPENRTKAVSSSSSRLFHGCTKLLSGEVSSVGGRGGWVIFTVSVFK